MTKHQQATINRLRARGYSVHVNGRARGDRILVTLRRQLTTGHLPLRILPDGGYECPLYDQHLPHSRRAIAWQS